MVIFSENTKNKINWKIKKTTYQIADNIKFPVDAKTGLRAETIKMTDKPGIRIDANSPATVHSNPKIKENIWGPNTIIKIMGTIIIAVNINVILIK